MSPFFSQDRQSRKGPLLGVLLISLMMLVAFLVAAAPANAGVFRHRERTKLVVKTWTRTVAQSPCSTGQCQSPVAVVKPLPASPQVPLILLVYPRD
jgi:hypothetical protein